jgi:hypothetical protein
MPGRLRSSRPRRLCKDSFPSGSPFAVRRRGLDGSGRRAPPGVHLPGDFPFRLRILP